MVHIHPVPPASILVPPIHFPMKQHKLGLWGVGGGGNMSQAAGDVWRYPQNI